MLLVHTQWDLLCLPAAAAWSALVEITTGTEPDQVSVFPAPTAVPEKSAWSGGMNSGEMGSGGMDSGNMCSSGMDGGGKSNDRHSLRTLHNGNYHCYERTELHL